MLTKILVNTLLLVAGRGRGDLHSLDMELMTLNVMRNFVKTRQMGVYKKETLTRGDLTDITKAMSITNGEVIDNMAKQWAQS